MDLREFPGTLQPVILHFGGNIGNENLWVEMPLICYTACHTFLCLLRIAYICILVKALSW
jgi:hypothetical protein